jgi:hypothetical protein
MGRVRVVDMSEYDRKIYWETKSDPEKYAAYLARKTREQTVRRLTPEGREYERTRKARWRARNPTAVRRIRDAGHAVEAALKRGKLRKPKACEDCGKRGRVEGHHHKGYAPEYWLDVLWLCAPCHAKVHRQMANAL